jgi:hypothetical protein
MVEICAIVSNHKGHRLYLRLSAPYRNYGSSALTRYMILSGGFFG